MTDQRLRESVAEVVKAVVLSSGAHPWDLNSGGCGEVADNVSSALGGLRIRNEILYTGEEFAGHTWIYVPKLKLHFDAETPYGEDCFAQMAYFLRSDEEPGPFTRKLLKSLGETALAYAAKPAWRQKTRAR